jgi:hypothetical protein
MNNYHKFLAFVALVILFGSLLTQFDLNINKRTTTELSLRNYDTLIHNNQSACLSYQLYSGEKYAELLRIEIGTQQHLKKEIHLSENITVSDSTCIPNSFFYYGDNIVEISFGSQSLFFHVTKLNETPQNTTVSEIGPVLKLNGSAQFTVKNGEAKGKSILMGIFVDGRLDHNVRLELQPGETEIVSEPLTLAGDKVVAKFATPFSKKYVPDSQENIIQMFFAAVLLFFLPGMLFTSKFFKFKAYSGYLASSMAFSIVIVTIVAWLLNFAGFLNATIWVVLAISLLLAIYPGKLHLPKGDQRVFTVMAAFILLTVAFQFTIPSHDSMWSVYYERQVDAVYDAGQIPLTDDLSYLGRGFTFVPGYMLFKSAYAWAGGVTPGDSFYIFEVLGNLFFTSAVIYFGKKLNFKLLESVIMLAILYSSIFLFGLASISLLHLYAMAFLILAMAFAYDNRYALAAVLLGISAIFHASFIFGFPIILFAIMKKPDWKKLLGATVAGGLIFLVLYSFVIFNYGMPTEIQKENWGYLINGSIIDLGTNTAGIMSLGVLAALFFGYRKERKLVLAITLLMLFFLAISYRVNLFLSIMAAVLFVRVFDSKQLVAIFLLFAASMVLTISVYQGVLGAEKIDPFTYIDTNTELSSNILVEPIYGHTANYLGNRKTLADLYVEYADEEKYLDEVAFIASWESGGDTSILRKWGISYTITEKYSRAIAVNQYIRPERQISFRNLDKIYDNGLLAIHYYRTNNQ